MKSKLATIIILIVMFLIIGVFGIFGFILWEECIKIETSAEPQDIKTVISENKNTIDKDIKTPQILDDPFDKIQGVKSEETEEIDYSNITINKYFYNQLEEYSKIIYKAFETNKENMKTGIHKVELGTAFTELLNEENGQEQLGKYYQSAIEAYTYDNPDVFYLSQNKMYLNIETTTKGKKNNI